MAKRIQEIKAEFDLASPEKKKNLCRIYAADERSGYSDESLNNERAGNVVNISREQVGKRRADASGGEAVNRAEHPCGDKYKAVAEINVAVQRRRDLNKHCSYADERCKHCGHAYLQQFVL